MEIFRGIGISGQPSLAQQITASMPSLDEWRKFLYCESATGPIYGEVDHFQVLGLVVTVACIMHRLALLSGHY